jgi:hypothetical protein
VPHLQSRSSTVAPFPRPIHEGGFKVGRWAKTKRKARERRSADICHGEPGFWFIPKTDFDLARVRATTDRDAKATGSPVHPQPPWPKKEAPPVLPARKARSKRNLPSNNGNR